MKNKLWIQTILLVSLIFLFIQGDLPVVADEKTRRLNVLYISVDDLNDWIACMGGHPDCKTPNIDRLAAKGMVFPQNYCPAPLCNPSRVALLTGMRPSTTGVYHNTQPWRKILPDLVSMPAYFKKNDYKVMGGGKIFHGGTNADNGFEDPTAWSEYFSKPKGPAAKEGGQTSEKKEPAPAKQEKGGADAGRVEKGEIRWGAVEGDGKDMADVKVADWAVGKLQEKHDRPFLLAVGISKPHLPWRAPQKHFDLFPPDSVHLPPLNPNDLDDVPPPGVALAKADRDHKKITEAGKHKEAVAAYLACIHFADACIGRVLDALEKSPYADNTIVVLWGDHGWHLGEKLHWRKFTLWEEGTRCPLIIVAPDVTPKGSVCRQTVNLMDIYPTLVDLCGLPKLEKVEAHSLVPLLKKPDMSWEWPSVTTYGKNNHAVRTSRWRYIRYADGSEELYDHDKDPNEWTNLANKSENSKIKKDLAQWIPTVNADDAPEDPNEM